MLLVHKNVYASLNIRMGLRTKRTTPHVICTSASEAVLEVGTFTRFNSGYYSRSHDSVPRTHSISCI